MPQHDEEWHKSQIKCQIKVPRSCVGRGNLARRNPYLKFEVRPTKVDAVALQGCQKIIQIEKLIPSMRNLPTHFLGSESNHK